MPRPEKVAAVAEIKERIEGAQAVFLAEYAGLSVKQQQDLRRGLRAQGAEFKVVKMTLARRAADELDLDLDELLLGPTGLAFADDDAVSAAKALKEFAAGNEVFTIKGGLLGRDFLTPERILELAEIAPREELLAMLAGALKAPMTSMAGLLAALPRGAATAFQQLLEKKQGGEYVGAAEAEESSSEPAEDTEAPTAATDDAAEAEAVEVTEEATASEGDVDVADPEADAAEADSEESAEAGEDADEAAEADEVAEADDGDTVEDAATAKTAAADSDEDDDTAEEAEEE